MKFTKILLILTTLLLIIGLTTGCSDSKTGLEKIQAEGKLVMGTTADYPPYEFHYLKDGKDTIGGYDIMIGQAIADELGVELVVEDMSFDGLLPALQSHKVDLVIAGLSPTEKRKEVINFSINYDHTEQKAIFLKENAEIFTSIEALTGKKIAAQKTSIQESIALNQIENAQVESLPSVADLVLQLQSGKVDAIIVEGPVAIEYAHKIDDFVVSEFSFSSDDQGKAIGINKEDTKLLEAVNKTLESLYSDDALEQMFNDASELAKDSIN